MRLPQAVGDVYLNLSVCVTNKIPLPEREKLPPFNQVKHKIHNTMRISFLFSLLFLSSVIATTEIDDIAQEIVSRSQSQMDLTSLWERIEYIQENYPIQSDSIQVTSPMGDTSMDKEIDETDPEMMANNNNSNNNTKKSKMSLIPLKRETLQAMIPDIAIDMAEAYTKYGLFYLDIKQI